MAEYNLWLERELEYNCIIEQLKSPFVIQVFGEYDGSAGGLREIRSEPQIPCVYLDLRNGG